MNLCKSEQSINLSCELSHSCEQRKGGLAPPPPPPSPQKIAPPNSQARIQGGLAPPGGQEGLAPPYKILDPPMLCQPPPGHFSEISTGSKIITLNCAHSNCATWWIRLELILSTPPPVSGLSLNSPPSNMAGVDRGGGGGGCGP